MYSTISLKSFLFILIFGPAYFQISWSTVHGTSVKTFVIGVPRQLPRRLWNYYFKKKKIFKLRVTSYQNKNFFICNPEKTHWNAIENQYKQSHRFLSINRPSLRDIFFTIIIFHYNLNIYEGFLPWLSWCCKFQLRESKPFSLQIFEKLFARNHCFLKSRSFGDHRKTVAFQEAECYLNIFSKNCILRKGLAE